jgi:hypothetical protein
MQNLSDISGDDSAELKRLCDQSAKEVRLVGSISAATGLEMVAHMRSLEIAIRELQQSTGDMVSRSDMLRVLQSCVPASQIPFVMKTLDSVRKV